MAILLVEDDLDLGRALQQSLQATHWPTVWVRHAQQARATRRRATYIAFCWI